MSRPLATSSTARTAAICAATCGVIIGGLGDLQCPLHSPWLPFDNPEENPRRTLRMGAALLPLLQTKATCELRLGEAEPFTYSSHVGRGDDDLAGPKCGFVTAVLLDMAPDIRLRSSVDFSPIDPPLWAAISLIRGSADTHVAPSKVIAQRRTLKLGYYVLNG